MRPERRHSPDVILKTLKTLATGRRTAARPGAQAHPKFPGEAFAWQGEGARQCAPRGRGVGLSGSPRSVRVGFGA